MDLPAVLEWKRFHRVPGRHASAPGRWRHDSCGLVAGRGHSVPALGRCGTDLDSRRAVDDQREGAVSLLRDRDSIYRSVFVQRVEGMGIKEKLIAPRSPWQNPYVERLIGSIQRECLDRGIVLHEHQLRQILEQFFAYYHEVRPHRSLAHDSPIPRPVQLPDHGKVIEIPLVGGLHHQYLRQAA